MDPIATQPDSSADFRASASFGIALASIVVISPFSINSFVQGRHVIGVLSLAILFVLAVIAWFGRQGRHVPLLTLTTFVPAVVAVLYLAIPQQGIIAALWCYPAILTFYAMLPERQAWFSNALLLGATFPQALRTFELPLASRFLATLLGVSIVATIFVRIISSQQRKLEAQALTDPLTGLFNRVTLRATLEHTIQQNQRSGSPMTLLAIDLDRFKSINDTLGHAAGDKVLRGVGELLGKRIRRADHVFRLGGEEFVALLYGTNLDDGKHVAEELRCAIESLALLPDRTVTASIGVATLLPGENWMTWMKRGDENLYRAKAEGRNRVAA